MFIKHFLYPTNHITLLTIFHFTYIPLPHKPWTHHTLYLHYLFILIHHHPRKDQPIPTSPHISPMNIHCRLKPRRIIYCCFILIKRVLFIYLLCPIFIHTIFDYLCWGDHVCVMLVLICLCVEFYYRVLGELEDDDFV